MKIELEIKKADAVRLQQICKMMGNSFRRYKNEPLGRTTIHNMTERDILTITDLSTAITDALISEDLSKYWR